MPTASIMDRWPEFKVYLKHGPLAGAYDNPLGARALYLYQGPRDTLYRIHGTNKRRRSVKGFRQVASACAISTSSTSTAASTSARRSSSSNHAAFQRLYKDPRGVLGGRSFLRGAAPMIVPVKTLSHRHRHGHWRPQRPFRDDRQAGQRRPVGAEGDGRPGQAEHDHARAPVRRRLRRLLRRRRSTSSPRATRRTRPRRR